MWFWQQNFLQFPHLNSQVVEIEMFSHCQVLLLLKLTVSNEKQCVLSDDPRYGMFVHNKSICMVWPLKQKQKHAMKSVQIDFFYRRKFERI